LQVVIWDKMDLDNLPPRLDKEQIEKLMKEEKIRFMSYGSDSDFFAILDNRHLYRKSSTGIYYLLSKNFNE